MHTSRTSDASQHAYRPAPDAAEGGGHSRGAGIRRRLDDALETSSVSWGAAARWASGVIGLDMFARAATYGARGHRHDEQFRAIVGGAAGLCLYASGIHDIVHASHLETDPLDPGRQLTHRALLSLGGVTVGCALSAVRNPIVGLFGSFAAFFSAYLATSVITAQLTYREARWREAGAGEAHGSRALTGAAVLALAAAALIAWVGAAAGTLITEGSPAAVFGKLIGAQVTILAILQVLPRLLSWKPPRSALADEGAV